jgi:hypothetical protein
MINFKGFTFTLLALLLVQSTNGLAQDSPELVEEAAKAQVEEQLSAEEAAVDMGPLSSMEVDEQTAPGEDATEAENLDEVKEAFAKDKTGTNPMNFTYDARLYDEYRWLNTDGDGRQNLLTAEFRAPFAGGKWQIRAKIRSNNLRADFNDDGFNDVSERGFGDTDIRVMTVPYMSMEKKLAVAVGVETFIDTASEEALGTGATSLAPFIFLGFFNPIGPGSIFVPGYQHTFSVKEADGRDKVHGGLIDMFLVKTWSDNKYWGYVDPQIILDYEEGTQFMLLEIQAGMMVGPAGHSIWAMPSFGVGNHRPYNFSLELGYKIVF